ncbi:flagellar basal body P-ring formation chaperone FlgA [Shewanella sp. A32]|uniref:flagellar basal body P-ring formation chaperone FlgA n=1 Tax=Shewanella sp. A32 TaxID=3031327 RepID=UPI0023B95DBA|nr:flagellar basal body P-ring formation chaperone FlgA [Shewanella sp. A32]MDF0535744.1 flagellar basal body P-ring formation chaperone FlgA [Shewanella sp. A32]
MPFIKQALCQKLNSLNINMINFRFEKFKHQKEVFFPLRKQSWLLFPLLLSLPAQAASALSTKLEQQVEKELTQYSRRLGVNSQKHQIELHFSGSTETQACEKWHFERPQPTQAPLGRLSYRIECLAPVKWTGRAIVEVKYWAKVVVTTKSVDRDIQLGKSELKLQTQELGSLSRTPLFHINDAVGKVTKRRLNRGALVSPFLLENPYIISRGDLVTMRITIDGFSAITKGTALEDARKGERLKVQNNSSGKVLQGVAEDNDLVEIDFAAK